MAQHTNIDEEIIEIWENFQYGRRQRNSGDLTLNYSGVRWEHKAFMNNPKKHTKIVTEEIDSSSQLNEVDQYFRAATNMTQSFKMGTQNYETTATIDIRPEYRLPKRYQNGRLSHEDGTPKQFSFPHIGEKIFMETFQTPLPSNAFRKHVTIPFVHTTVTADLRVRTYFTGEVNIKQGHGDGADLNGMLGAAQIDHMKSDRNGLQYFESNGTIQIDIRRLQH